VAVWDAGYIMNEVARSILLHVAANVMSFKVRYAYPMKPVCGLKSG
jgi:hypothetical protein